MADDTRKSSAVDRLIDDTGGSDTETVERGES